VFTAQYTLSLCIKQIRLVFKGLIVYLNIKGLFVNLLVDKDFWIIQYQILQILLYWELTYSFPSTANHFHARTSADKLLLQFSAEQLPTLQEQLRRQEEKVRAAAPDSGHVKALTKVVAKAQIGTDTNFLTSFSPVCFYKLESWTDDITFYLYVYVIYIFIHTHAYKHHVDTLSAQ
jgi:hypothetical protein